MSGARIYARNLAANWLGQIIGVLVMFFLSPFVVHTLGKTEFGIWGLLNVFTGYLGIFDLGVRSSVGRFVILYIGRQDHDSVNDTLKTGISFFSLVSIGILLAAVGAGFLFPVFFPTIPVAYHNEIRFLLPLMALNIYLSAISGALTSLLAAHDRFDLQQVVDISMLVVRTAATVVVLLVGYGIVGMTVVAVGATALAVMGNWWMARRIYRHLRLWPLRMSRKRLRELFGFGIPAFIGSVAGNLVGQTDLIVVGALLGVNAVAVYSVGASLLWYSKPLLGHIDSVVFPSIQRSVAVEDRPAVQWTYLRLWKAMLAFGILVYLGFIFFGENFIRLWMGNDFAEAFTVTFILSVTRLLGLMSGGAGSVLYAKGRVWLLTALGVTSAVMALSLSVTFVYVLHWGLAGVASGYLVVTLLMSWITPWYANREMGIKAGTVVKRVFVPAIVAAAAFSGWCFLVRTFVPGSTWVLFAAQVGLALAGYAPIALFILVPEADRKRIFRFLRILPAETSQV